MPALTLARHIVTQMALLVNINRKSTQAASLHRGQTKQKTTRLGGFFVCIRATKKIFLSYLNKVSNSNGFIQLQEIIRETEFYSRFVVFNKLIQHLLDFA